MDATNIRMNEKRFLGTGPGDAESVQAFVEVDEHSVETTLRLNDGSNGAYFNVFAYGPEAVDAAVAKLERLQAVMDTFYQTARAALLEFKEEKEDE